MGYLADAREFTVAHVGNAARGKYLDHRLDGAKRHLRAGCHSRHHAGIDDLRVAAYRAADELSAALAKPLANRSRLLNRYCRAVDKYGRHLVGGADPVRTKIDFFQVLPGGYNGKQHIDIGEIG